MKFLPLLLMTFGAMLIGCERHDFEDTRELHIKPPRESSEEKTESAEKTEH